MAAGNKTCPGRAFQPGAGPRNPSPAGSSSDQTSRAESIVHAGADRYALNEPSVANALLGLVTVERMRAVVRGGAPCSLHKRLKQPRRRRYRSSRRGAVRSRVPEWRRSRSHAVGPRDRWFGPTVSCRAASTWTDPCSLSALRRARGPLPCRVGKEGQMREPCVREFAGLRCRRP